MSKNSPPKLDLICSSCRQAKSSLKNDYHCGVCQSLLCKDCVQFLDDSFFSFLKTVPEELKLNSYCGICYDQKVTPVMTSYLEVMGRAKNIYVFYKKDRTIPLIRQSKVKEAVQNCDDRDETILRLAFFAAQQSFNAIIEVDLIPKKIRTNGYQKTSWGGTGFPAEIRVSRIKENIS